MENKERSMTDRFVNRTEKAFLKITLATLVGGSVVAVNEADIDAYKKTVITYGPLATGYTLLGAWAWYSDRKNRSEEKEQSPYREMTA